MTNHTASDFAPIAANPYALALDCQRVASKLALERRYEEAVREYLVSVTYLRMSSNSDAAAQIAFAEGEIERLETVTGGSR